MDNLEHEDLLIRLRAKLNDEKVKLWETPYVSESGDISQSLKDLATKYATSLKLDENEVLQGLYELQVHSIERLKANEEFKETGNALLRVKANVPGDKPKLIKISKPLSLTGEELVSSLAEVLNVDKDRIKLIYNGKIINRNKNLEEQGLKNGAQLMALVMTESPEEIKKEDNMYMKLKSTLDDADLLTEFDDDQDFGTEYMKLEDQSGKAIDLPASERKALLIGLALHERGRAAAKNKDYSLALVLLLEADKQLNECRSSILSSVDNCAVLQLDIAWCYLCLQNLASANDAAARLTRAEKSFNATYGEDHHRLIALKGTNANERVLFMRLYLLQGIVAYHQNKRADAKALLEKAEKELNTLKIDETSVVALMELGWSEAQARTGLRAASGQLDRAHQLLEEKRKERQKEREKHRENSQAWSAAVRALCDMGFPRRAAARALRRTQRHVGDAARLLHDQPHLFEDCLPDFEDETPSSDDSVLEPDNKLVAELESMGYPAEEARTALRLAYNHVDKAVDLLLTGQPCVPGDTSNPSTSNEGSSNQMKANKKEKRKKEQESALRRLKNEIRTDEEEYLNSSLAEEEHFLAQYKSLL